MIGSPAVGINLDYGNSVYFKDKPTLKEAIQQSETLFIMYILRTQ